MDGQTMIIREAGSMTRAAFEATLSAHQVKPVIVMELPRDSVHEAVIEGIGIGIVSEAEYQNHNDLIALRIADMPSFTRSYVICLRSRRFSKPIAAFVELAESQAIAPQTTPT